jgi:hypothetical protein
VTPSKIRTYHMRIRLPSTNGPIRRLRRQNHDGFVNLRLGTPTLCCVWHFAGHCLLVTRPQWYDRGGDGTIGKRYKKFGFRSPRSTLSHTTQISLLLLLFLNLVFPCFPVLCPLVLGGYIGHKHTLPCCMGL